MLRLFNKMAEQGRIANREQFKRIEGTDKLWEFKSFKIRMPCYFLGSYPKSVTALEAL